VPAKKDRACDGFLLEETPEMSTTLFRRHHTFIAASRCLCLAARGFGSLKRCGGWWGFYLISLVVGIGRLSIMSTFRHLRIGVLVNFIRLINP
jgi:hypothetical protein